MTNNQTIIFFVALLIYLISIPFIYNAIGKDVTVDYTSSEKSFMQGTFVGNVITGLTDAPLWFNTILIYIPIALLIFCGILLLLHG